MQAPNRNQKSATCPGCGKVHKIDWRTYAMFGPDTWCLKCVKWEHVRFMQATGRKLGLSCNPGCPCGLGGKVAAK